MGWMGEWRRGWEVERARRARGKGVRARKRRGRESDISVVWVLGGESVGVSGEVYQMRRRDSAGDDALARIRARRWRRSEGCPG